MTTCHIWAQNSPRNDSIEVKEKTKIRKEV